jgi:hypothetical protein
MFTCPVCGYNQLQYPPTNENICPSCYTEFGYDDATRSYAELRAEWLANGAHWEGANVMQPPQGWNAYEQLANLEPERATSETTSSITGQVHWVGRVINDPGQARFFSQRVQRFANLNDLIFSQTAHA